MPEVSRFIGINFEVFFHHIGILVEFFVATLAELRVSNFDQALRSLAIATVSHEYEIECFAEFGKAAHFGYSFINCHDTKVIWEGRRRKDSYPRSLTSPAL